MAEVNDIPVGQVRAVLAENRSYVVANVGGEFLAVDNRCPHLGGPLARGKLDGAVITCPWHGWEWDLRTGRPVWPAAARDRARPVPVRVEDGGILLGLL
ncbi:MAG: Rieske (2Fe-2S) protein [Chloroflexi bacterium]|nr:Rieske (2Fe-2S) protein [Chloroflexota bacterium]